jgi:hypothetical protein
MKVKDIISHTAIQYALKLCVDELNLNELPQIEFIDEPFIGDDNQRSFGEFNGNSIRVVAKDRHLVDLIRTLSHELVHWKQSLDSNNTLDGSTGSDTENEANSVAGVIMRKFGKMYPDYFIDPLI